MTTSAGMLQGGPALPNVKIIRITTLMKFVVLYLQYLGLLSPLNVAMGNKSKYSNIYKHTNNIITGEVLTLAH